MPHLRYSIEDRIATLVLENPPQNRIDEQMADELAEAVDVVGRSDARAVLLRADGSDFSFGGDIVTWPDLDARELRTLFERYTSVFNRFEQLPMPVIAAVHGLCFGGGFELALRADVIFAAESARFGHPEQSIAIVTLLGGIYRVAERAGRSRASEWALTSEQVPAAVMAAAGVVNRVVADEALLGEASAFARRVARGPPAPTPRQGAPARLGDRRRRGGGRGDVRHRHAAVRDRGCQDHAAVRGRRVQGREGATRLRLPGPMTATCSLISGRGWKRRSGSRRQAGSQRGDSRRGR